MRRISVGDWCVLNSDTIGFPHIYKDEVVQLSDVQTAHNGIAIEVMGKVLMPNGDITSCRGYRLIHLDDYIEAGEYGPMFWSSLNEWEKQSDHPLL